MTDKINIEPHKLFQWYQTFLNHQLIIKLHFILLTKIKNYLKDSDEETSSQWAGTWANGLATLRGDWKERSSISRPDTRRPKEKVYGKTSRSGHRVERFLNLISITEEETQNNNLVGWLIQWTSASLSPQPYHSESMNQQAMQTETEAMQGPNYIDSPSLKFI